MLCYVDIAFKLSTLFPFKVTWYKVRFLGEFDYGEKSVEIIFQKRGNS